MIRNKIFAASLLAAFALAACNGGAGQGVVPSNGAMAPQTATDPSFLGLGPENGFYPMTTPDAAVPMCPYTGDVHEFRCFAWMRTDLHPDYSRVAPGSFGIPSSVGYTPAQIQAAYHLDATKGSGQTVYIVDAYGYKQIASDLTKYRAGAGLPACSTSSGCFKVLNQKGKPSPLPPVGKGSQASWQFEESLDVDAVSAACPKCKIVMIQATTSANTDLEAGILAALGLGAKIVSMSFGTSEFLPADPGLPTGGIALVASAGDSGGGLKHGGGPQMPCTYAAVICVGGTALTNASSKWSEVVWNDAKIYSCSGTCGATGSGCSKIVPKPSWQAAGNPSCSRRAAADVAADASPLTPLAIYNTPICKSVGGWCGAGGTSLAAPLIAGVIGLAGNATSRHGAMEIWKSHTKLNDITKGTNVYKPVTGPCASSVVYICTARAGYDGPTGWGTPNTSANL